MKHLPSDRNSSSLPSGATPLFFKCFLLWLCALGVAGPPPARAGTAYDAQAIVAPPMGATNESGGFWPQLNRDGAFATCFWDPLRNVYAIGRWTPSALYGMSAGYHELYTWSPTPDDLLRGGFVFSAAIEDNGDVSYLGKVSLDSGGLYWWTWQGTLVFGGARGEGRIPFNGLFGWTHDTNTYAYSMEITLTHANDRVHTSDPIPYVLADGQSHKTDEDISPWPDFEYYFPFIFNGSIQLLTPPAGDYGRLAVMTKQGYAVWYVFNVDSQQTGRHPTSGRMIAVTPAGTFDMPGVFDFMDGQGNLAFHGSSASPGSWILLAVPLAGLGPGVHLQSEIPGMPPGAYIRLGFNSSGTFLINDGDLGGRITVTHIITGGKAAPVGEVLPSVALGTWGVTVMGLNEAGLMIAEPSFLLPNGRLSFKEYLLTPTLDCDLSPSVPPPYRLGQEFDLVMTVSNLTSAAVTNLRMEGDSGSPGLSQSANTFDILTGPTPAGPLTLGSGATTTFTYHCVAKRAGGGIVAARIRAIAPTGNPLRGYADTAVQVVQFADLQIKLSSESATNFALVGVYQTTPADQQVRKVELVSDDEVAGYEVKVVNNEPMALALRLKSQESGSANIPVSYTAAGNDISASIAGYWSGGWITPTLAQGESVIVHVQFGPGQSAVSGEIKSAQIRVCPVDGSATLDVVRAEVVKAPPIAVTLRRPAAAGLTPASLEAGKGAGQIDAPLVFVTDPAALSQLPVVLRGLVADGVTPLLLQLVVSPEQFGGLPGDIDYTIALEVAEGGTLADTPAAGRLQVLKNGQWITDQTITFSSSQLTNFACLTPVRADHLRLNAGAGQVKLHVHFTRAGSGADAGEKTFYLSKPPIALVHGYNTTGDWDPKFTSILEAARPAGFVRTIKYGQQPPSASAYSLQTTVLQLATLAPVLKDELEASMWGLRSDWAFTRHDVVAHSQGGLLTRMLCSQNGNAWVPLPFRNGENFNRGRFHRVITIGSPHNGSRLVAYLEDLKERYGASPSFISTGGALAYIAVSLGISQPKFNPFRPEIQQLNDPSPNAPWFPDSGAPFHLIQATVDYGSAPGGANGVSLAESLLGMKITGSAVFPKGSDGIVDFDSMAASSSVVGQSLAPNTYRMPMGILISHANIPFPAQLNRQQLEVTGSSLLGGDAGEVDSPHIANHVLDALDQNPLIQAADRVFAPFRLPELLPLSISNEIYAASARVTLAPKGGIQPSPGLAGRRGPKSLVSPAYTFAPSGVTLEGPVTWFAERYGRDGINSYNLELLPDSAPGNANGVIVKYDDAEPGDIVLYATATTEAGDVIVSAPEVIASIEPDTNNYALDSISISPGSGVYSVGTAIQPDFWATYASLTGGDPLVLQRWVDPQTLAGNISAWPGIMDFSDPLLWKFTAVGYTIANVNWLGMTATPDFTVYDPEVGGVDGDFDGVPDTVEASVPGRNGQPQGDGNGDGLADSRQTGVVSLLCPSGQWLTLNAPASPNVQFCLTHLVQAPADTSLLPQPYAFDQGFLTLSAFGFANGGTAVIRLFLPTNTQPDTVWAYGPEPGNSTPHWYAFVFDGVTGAEFQTNTVLLHLQDSGRGDSDGSANGAVNGLVLGFARLISTPPALQVARGDQGTVILTWPAVFPNADHTYLEATDDLGPSNQWQFVPDVPIQNGEQNMVIKSAGGGAKFYRLHSQ